MIWPTKETGIAALNCTETDEAENQRGPETFWKYVVGRIGVLG
jgi:hypothetical protein